METLRTYPRIWKGVYDPAIYAVAVGPDENILWLEGDINPDFTAAGVDQHLSCKGGSWHQKEIPYEQYRRELYQKVYYRRRRMSKIDDKLFDECIKLCNANFFWSKDYNKETHSMQFLHQKTGAMFDVSAKEFVKCPTPQAALELVETQHAIYNVAESGK